MRDEQVSDTLSLSGLFLHCPQRLPVQIHITPHIRFSELCASKLHHLDTGPADSGGSDKDSLGCI